MADQGNIFGNDECAEQQQQQQQQKQQQEQQQQQEQPPVVINVDQSIAIALEPESEDMETSLTDSSFLNTDSGEVEMNDVEPNVAQPAAEQQLQGQEQQAAAAGSNPYLTALSIYGVVPHLINIIGERNGFTAPASFLNETFFETMAQAMPRLMLTSNGVPQEQCTPLAFPMIDMGAICNDYPTMHRLMLMTEMHFEELVRLWHALQATLQLMAAAMAQFPVPPVMDPEDPDYDQDRVNNWTVYQRQLDEFVQVAEMFAQLIQYELCGVHHP